MDPLTQHLRQRAADLDTTGLDTAGTLGRVVRRGKLYLAATTVVATIGATSFAFAAVTVVPGLVEQIRPDPGPEILDEPSEPEVEIVEDVDLDVPDDEETAPVALAAPALTITAPVSGSEVTSDTVLVAGTTDPGATLTVDGDEVAVADDGGFEAPVALEEGDNLIEVVASLADGPAAVRRVGVTYLPPADGSTDAPVKTPTEPAPTKPAPTTTEKPKKDAPAPDTSTLLTASQDKGKVVGNPPKNTYRGTAAPGAKVAVLSQYGSGYAWADDAGTWQVKVVFDQAPAGTTTFPVKVKLHHQPDVRRTFELTTVRDQAPTDWQLTANQQHAEVAGDPPVNRYWGTATPGAKVKVFSDHGYGYAYADGAGNWSLDLAFDGVPSGTKTFTVTAKLYEAPHISQSFSLTTVRAGTGVDFTAKQLRNSVTAADPTGLWEGTAEPGRQVLVWTDGHGELTVIAGSDGTWRAEFTLIGVSEGQTVPVKARDKASGEAVWFDLQVTP